MYFTGSGSDMPGLLNIIGRVTIVAPYNLKFQSRSLSVSLLLVIWVLIILYPNTKIRVTILN